MADERTRIKNRNVDDAGMRLAPTPIRNSDYHVLPSIRQEYVLEPSLHIDEPKEDLTSEFSTADDFQPKVKDMSKKWKRRKRGKNIIFGAIMLIATLLVVLPYILAAAGQTINLPLKYVPQDLNAIGNLIEAFKLTAANGWTGPELKDIWVSVIPSLVLTLGIIFLAFNLLKSLFALLGAVKPVKYMANAFIYLVCVLIILVFYLIGVNAFGIDQINFVNDFIKAYSTSELFCLVIIAIANVLVSTICTLLNKDKLGYIR